MRQTKQKFASKDYGFKLQLRANDQLIIPRFADDVPLLAESLDHLAHVLADLITEVGKPDLEPHPDKTQPLQHCDRPPLSTRVPYSVHLFGMKIGILPLYRRTRYIGRRLQHATEEGG